MEFRLRPSGLYAKWAIQAVDSAVVATKNVAEIRLKQQQSSLAAKVDRSEWFAT